MKKKIKKPEKFELKHELSGKIKELEIRSTTNWLTKENLYFPEFLNGVFEEFINLIKSNKEKIPGLIESDIDDISVYCQNLVDVVNLYLIGKLMTSESLFNVIFDKIKSFLFYTNSNQHVTNWVDKNCKQLTKGQVYYRARPFKENVIFDRLKIFHRPFEDRNKLKNYRFSISGLPCLYLANNPLTIWLEFEKPKLNNLCFSKFLIKENLKFLDLSYFGGQANLKFIESREVEIEKWGLQSMVNWPIRFACLIPRKIQEGIFHEEYILPQILLKYVQEDGSIDGVIYESSRSGQQPFGRFLNYAIPVKSSKIKGYCSTLSNKMAWSNPKRFEDLKSINGFLHKSSDEFREKFF